MPETLNPFDCEWSRGESECLYSFVFASRYMSCIGQFRHPSCLFRVTVSSSHVLRHLLAIGYVMIKIEGDTLDVQHVLWTLGCK